jgi:hypothetical protein
VWQRTSSHAGWEPGYSVPQICPCSWPVCGIHGSFCTSRWAVGLPALWQVCWMLGGPHSMQRCSLFLTDVRGQIFPSLTGRGPSSSGTMNTKEHTQLTVSSPTVCILWFRVQNFLFKNVYCMQSGSAKKNEYFFLNIESMRLQMW